MKATNYRLVMSVTASWRHPRAHLRLSYALTTACTRGFQKFIPGHGAPAIYLSIMSYPRNTRVVLSLLAASVALGGTACDDFATPAELAGPQILAVQAEPAAVLPGETTTLSILVADQSGEVTDPAVNWQITPTNPGEPLLGELAAGETATALYTAPGDVTATVTVASVTADVTIASDVLTAVKAIPIGSVPISNPEMQGLRADGDDILDTSSLTLSAGQTVTLEVDVGADTDGDMTTFAWYSTAGEIERYQSNPTELVVRDTTGDTWLFVVVRNGLGGVIWHGLEMVVE